MYLLALIALEQAGRSQPCLHQRRAWTHAQSDKVHAAQHARAEGMYSVFNCNDLTPLTDHKLPPATTTSMTCTYPLNLNLPLVGGVCIIQLPLMNCDFGV